MLPLLGTSNIHRFSLRCDELCDDSRISAMVSSVIRCKVVKMNLIFKHKRPFLLPSTLFTCESLEKLWIRSSSVLYLPKSISFPRLKLLQLALVEFTDECLTEQLFSNCPVLEELIIRWCNWVNMKAVCISAPALKCLIIDCIGDPLNINILHNCEVKIHAPSLVSLTYRDCIAKEFVFSSLSSLVDAKIDIDVGDSFPETRQEETEYCAAVTKFLRQIVNVKHLKISGNTLEVLSFAEDLLTDLPTFYNLIQLEVLSVVKYYAHKTLFPLIQTAPNLESLVFCKVFSPYLHDDGDGWLLDMDTVSESLFRNIKFVQFKEFFGTPGEMKLARVILNNASALQMMTITCTLSRDLSSKVVVMEELLRFPRGSPSCVIEFS
ncbi:putative F-box/FBD/LRR-repeat protein At5g22670 [Papaver somniferum]|nr:putative F-box/FBD/LRR-repeat protein At5g22670 [Papaver somniferum]